MFLRVWKCVEESHWSPDCDPDWVCAPLPELGTCCLQLCNLRALDEVAYFLEQLSQLKKLIY